MGKLTDQDAERRRTGPSGCIVDRLLESMDDDDRALLLSWLHDAQLGAPTIERRLRDAGFDVSDSSIHRWRNRNDARSVWAA